MHIVGSYRISAGFPDLSCVPAPKRLEQDILLLWQSPPPSTLSCYCLLVDYSLSPGRLIIWVSLSLSSAVLGKPLPSASSFRDQLFFGRERGSMTMKSFHFFFLQLLTRESKAKPCTSSQERKQREPWRLNGLTPPITWAKETRTPSSVGTTW